MNESVLIVFPGGDANEGVTSNVLVYSVESLSDTRGVCLNDSVNEHESTDVNVLIFIEEENNSVYSDSVGVLCVERVSTRSVCVDIREDVSKGVSMDESEDLVCPSSSVRNSFLSATKRKQ